VKIEPEAERAYCWPTLALCDQAEEVLVIAADDHGCRIWSAGGLYERVGAGPVHLHSVLTRRSVWLSLKALTRQAGHSNPSRPANQSGLYVSPFARGPISRRPLF
jgi:hypothetical protein